jgi:hypothetical protein
MLFHIDGVMRNTTLKFFEKLYQAASPLLDKIKCMWYKHFFEE